MHASVRPAILSLAAACSASIAQAQSTYEQDVVAATGGLGITAIAPEVSINDGRRVAFVATLIDPTNNQAYPSVFADLGTPSTARNISTSISSTNTPQFGPGLQLTNGGLVVTRRFEQIPSPLGPIPATYIETWNSNATNTRSTIVYGEPLFGTFDGLYPHPSINNLGGTVFAALDQSLNYLGTLTSAGGFTVQLTAALPKPQMADDNEFVMRVGTGSITKFPPAFFPNTVIASAAVGNFGNLGEKPGVSDDGRVVAFTGDRGNGQGIFVSLALGGTRRILTVAGEGDGFVNIAVDERVGVTADGTAPRFRVAFLAEFQGRRGCYVVEGVPEFDTITGNWVANRRPPALAIGIGDTTSAGTVADLSLYDPINKFGDVACRAVLTNGGQAVIRARRASIELLDGSEERLRTGTDVTNNAALLAVGGLPRQGIAADGAARLVLRVPVPGPGQVMFELVGATNTADYGRVYPCGAPANTTVTTVATTNQVPNFYGIACYRAPDNFVRNGSAADAAAPTRFVRVRATFTPLFGTPTTYEVPVTIVRPPLVLCHGLWSDPGTWDNSPLVGDPRFEITRVDYKATNARQFAVNAPLVGHYIQLAKERMARREIAAARVDWVGHSMGGLLPRYYIAEYNYARDDNFSEGDIHKLITLNTPHWGSPLPSLLQVLGQSQDFTDFARSIDMPIDEGAIVDLSEGSAELQRIGQTPSLAKQPGLRLSCHAVGGTGGTTIVNGVTLSLRALGLIAPPPFSRILSTAGSAVTMTSDALFRFQAHDLCVILSSQHGGFPAATTTTYNDLFSHHLKITSHVAAAQRVVQLLNADVLSSEFLPRIAPPNPTPPATIPLPPTLNPTVTGSFNLGLVGTPSSVTPGQSVTATATAMPGYTLTSVLFFGPDEAVFEDTQAPFQATFTVPQDAAGQAKVTAIASLAGGAVEFLTTPISVPVAIPATLLSLELPDERMTISEPTVGVPFTVYGVYSDGIRRRLDGVPGLQLTASPAGVVSIGSNGMVQALANGATIVTATLQNVSDTCRVTVAFDPLATYGQGTPGAGQQVPQIAGIGLPTLGNQQFAVLCTRAAGGVPGWVVYALGQARQPLLGGELLVDLATAAPVFRITTGIAGQVGVGTAMVATPIPASPAIVGVTLYGQGLFLDPMAAQGISSTAGLRIRITP